MPRNRLEGLPLFALAATLVAFGCASDAPPDRPAGSLSMNLVLPGGVTIDEVSYAITGTGIIPTSGAVDTSAATSLSLTVSVPSGQGHLLEMSALSTDGLWSCSGSTNFDIMVGQTTNVTVILGCRRTGDLNVGGQFNLCPQVLTASASAQEAELGSSVTLSVQASDEEGDPVSYLWSGAGGSFDDASSPNPTYTCDLEGTHTVSVVISDDGFTQCVGGWTVAVTCLPDDMIPPIVRAWGNAEVIGDESQIGVRPQVTTDPSGNVTAVWQQNDGASNNIWANRYVPGTGWLGPALISFGPSSPGLVPKVAADAIGNVTAVWQQDDAGSYSIWANRYVPGSGWLGPELLELDSTASATNPQVSAGPNGQATAVFTQGGSVYANRYLPGTGWLGAEPLELLEAQYAANGPQVTSDPSGNVTAVWYQDDGLRSSIWANRYLQGWGWLGPELVELDDLGNAYEPQVIADAAGNITVAWTRGAGVYDDVWANRYVPGTGWGTAELLETDDEGDAYYPDLAIDPSGHVTVAWLQNDGSYDSIYANRYAPGTGWGTAELLETDDSDDAGYVQVTADATGHVTALWSQPDGTADSIYARRYVPGTGWGVAELLETNDVGDAFYKDLTADPSGNVTAVWSQSDGSGNKIYANRYE